MWCKTRDGELHKVDEEFACPRCGERLADELVFITDDEVECQSCKMKYLPGSHDARLYRQAFKAGYQKGAKDGLDATARKP